MLLAVKATYLFIVAVTMILMGQRFFKGRRKNHTEDKKLPRWLFFILAFAAFALVAATDDIIASTIMKAFKN